MTVSYECEVLESNKKRHSRCSQQRDYDPLWIALAQRQAPPSVSSRNPNVDELTDLIGDVSLGDNFLLASDIPEWKPVSRRKQHRTRKPDVIDRTYSFDEELDDSSIAEDQSDNIKEFYRRRHSRKGSGQRHNRRELRKQAFIKRKAKVLTTTSIEPHSLEDDYIDLSSMPCKACNKVNCKTCGSTLVTAGEVLDFSPRYEGDTFDELDYDRLADDPNSEHYFPRIDYTPTPFPWEVGGLAKVVEETKPQPKQYPKPDPSPLPPPPPVVEKTTPDWEKEQETMYKAAETAPPLTKDIAKGSSTLQRLLDIVDVPKELFDNDDDASDWLSYIENIVILGYQIHRATTFSDIFVAVVGYIKMHTSKSVIREIVKILEEVTTQCGKESVMPHGLCESAEAVRANWDLLKSNAIYTKISYLLTAAMSLTVCKIKHIEWSICGLQLISLEAAKTQATAKDVIDAAIHTFTWMITTGYRVIQEKSLLPLVYADNKMQKFNQDCDYCLAHAEQVLAGNGGNVQDFEHKVDHVLRQVSELKSMKSEGPTAIWLQQRYSQLVDIKYKIVAKHRNTAIRFQPFGVGLTGPSGVGKSSLSKIVMKCSLHAMGFSHDPKRIITKDMYDKYDSTYTSDILGMFMDDVGNGKAQFTPTSPTDIIIKFFNNMAAQAVKAELNAKGVVFIAFKVGVITSNFEDYQVRCYANIPEAALRRFIHTRVEIKPKYRIPGGISLNTHHPDLVGASLLHDVWQLRLEECFIYKNKQGQDAYRFRTLWVKVDGKLIECDNLDLATYIDVINILAKQHKEEQNGVVSRSEEFDQMEMCGTCDRPAPMCKCCKNTIPNSFEHLGDVVANAALSATKRYFDSWIKPVNLVNWFCGYYPVNKLSTRQLSHEMYHLIDRTATPWMIALTPEFMFRTPLFQRSVTLWQHSAAMLDLRRWMWGGSVAGASLMGYGAYRKNVCIFGFAFCGSWVISMGLWSHYQARMAHYKREYLLRRDALPDFAQHLRDKNKIIKGATIVCASVIGIKCLKIWNQQRKKEGLLVSPAGLDNMDDSPGWFGFMMNSLGVQVKTSESSKRASPSQIISTLQKSNLFWAEFKRADGTSTRCNIFFPRKSVAWFPEHVFYKDSNMNLPPTALLTVVVYRHNNPGGKFEFKCELSSCSKLDDLDLVCVYVPNCPDLRDKLKWLPESLPTGKSMSTLVCREDDKINIERVNVEHGKFAHCYKSFYGGSYTSNIAKVGACMGPLVLEQKEPTIIGFHIGGNPKHQYGVMQTITREMATALLDKLEAMPGVVLSALATELPDTQYNRNLLASKDVHPHSMFARLKQDDYIDIIGSTKLRTMQKSTVQKSVLSDAVLDVTQIPSIWGAPRLVPNWKGFNATLEHIVNPSAMFVPSKLERARQDWLKPLLKAMREYVKTEDFRPLTMREMILGINGKRFLDAVKMMTSMGFPIFGKKSKYFTDVWEDGVLIDRIPSPELIAEMERIFACWERGERAYPVTSATLKDEPTKTSSEKVRVFQAVAVALGLYIRKYFLPIARFLSMHPLLSESAVGVNAFSNEWEELMGHANKFAPDKKVIAWDYSKYDVRMNSQVTRAVLVSFIDLAREGGYDEHSLKIMKNMIVDIVHPLIDYNGTMMMAYNMNTSGNNITVNINSVAGSLYVRLGFFDQYPDEKEFRKCVAAMTYGDDFKGSVHEDYRNFNFFSFKDFLAAHGMKITLPDKSDDAVAFMDDAEADFLKRQSSYIEEIGTSIGRLDENSIFKSLHCNLKSSSTLPVEVAASCIESAMHEWFAFGREHYEMRAAQMRQVCEITNIPVPATRVTFDERVTHWLDKYKA